MPGPDLKRTLTLRECRERGYEVFGWCSDHGTRTVDLSGPAGQSMILIDEKWRRRTLTCGKCHKPLSAVTVKGHVNMMVGTVVMAEWRMG